MNTYFGDRLGINGHTHCVCADSSEKDMVNNREKKRGRCVKLSPCRVSAATAAFWQLETARAVCACTCVCVQQQVQRVALTNIFHALTVSH